MLALWITVQAVKEMAQNLEVNQKGKHMISCFTSNNLLALFIQVGRGYWDVLHYYPKFNDNVFTYSLA